MALGPEAWFVWRRTVFPDYLLEAVVEPDVLAAAGCCPSAQAVADICADARAAAVAAAAVGSAALPARRHPRQSRSRDDGAFARGALPAARSSRHRARRGAVGCAPRRRAADQAAVPRGDPAVGAAAVLARPKRGFGVPLRRWFHGADDRLGARDPRSIRGPVSAAGRAPREVARAACSSTKTASAITPSGSGRWSASSCGRARTSTGRRSRERACA